MSRVYQEHGKVKIYRCSIGFETKLRNFAFVCSPACAKRSLGGKLAKSECAKDFFSADRVKMDGAEMESRRAGFIS